MFRLRNSSDLGKGVGPRRVRGVQELLWNSSRCSLVLPTLTIILFPKISLGLEF